MFLLVDSFNFNFVDEERSDIYMYGETGILHVWRDRYFARRERPVFHMLGETSVSYIGRDRCFTHRERPVFYM